ncbi:MAG: energy transducer TonB [Pseudomonadota bacterium]
MKQHLTLISGLILCLPFTTQIAHAESEKEATVHRGINAKPITLTPPRYPQSELRDKRQGWVELSYVVTADGKVIDPVIEDSSGSKAFEKQALRTVTEWTYEPATWDGEPVQQCETQMRLVFALEGAGTGVTKRYRRRHNRISKIIDSGDYDEAQKLINNYRDNNNMSLSETSWLWTLQTRLSGLVGDKKQQLAAVRKATESSSWVDKKLYPDLLLVRTALELEEGNFAQAIRNHEALRKAKADHPKLKVIEPHITTIKEKVAGDTILQTKAEIGENDNWYYRPLRRKFSIADLDGELRDIEFRCSWQRTVTKAEEGTSWSLPKDWGDCSIYVFGEPGTTFNLLEIPEEA